MFWIFVGFGLLASAISVNKVLLFSLPPVFFVGLRMTLGGALLFALNYKNSKHLKFSYFKKDLIPLAIIALCTTFVPSIFKAFGLKYLVSSKAAFIGALDPFITAIYSYILWKEVLSPQKIIGVALGFIGTLTLCFGTSPVEQTFYNFMIFSLPELAMFFSVALGRFGWIRAQIMLKRDRYAPPELNALMMLLAGGAALIASQFIDDFGFRNIPMNWNFFGLMAYTVIMGNVIAYTMYAQFLKAYSASFVSLAGFSVPLFVTFYGRMFLGETVSPNLVASALVILLGVAIFYRDEIKARILK